MVEGLGYVPGVCWICFLNHTCTWCVYPWLLATPQICFAMPWCAVGNQMLCCTLGWTGNDKEIETIWKASKASRSRPASIHQLLHVNQLRGNVMINRNKNAICLSPVSGGDSSLSTTMQDGLTRRSFFSMITCKIRLIQILRHELLRQSMHNLYMNAPSPTFKTLCSSSMLI